MSKKQVIFSDGKRKTFEKIIKQQTAEKKRELNRSLDNKVDGLFSKKYPLFLKDIKVKKDLDILKKASAQLDAFERELETKKERLKDSVKVDCNIYHSCSSSLPVTCSCNFLRSHFSPCFSTKFAIKSI